MTLARQGHWDEAMDCYDEAIGFVPISARRGGIAHWAGWPTATSSADVRSPNGGCKCRKSARIPVSPPALGWRAPRGTPILLHYEQGLGDTLQFIRFAPQVKERGARCGSYANLRWIVWLLSAPGVDRVLDGESPLPNFHVQPLL